MTDYKAADLELLKGLDPVKRRPGMYTQYIDKFTRPNHLLILLVHPATQP